MFKTALFIKTSNCKEPQYPLKGEWANSVWFIQAMECYSAITKNELPMWINLSNSMFLERGQVKKKVPEKIKLNYVIEIRTVFDCG